MDNIVLDIIMIAVLIIALIVFTWAMWIAFTVGDDMFTRFGKKIGLKIRKY